MHAPYTCTCIRVYVEVEPALRRVEAVPPALSARRREVGHNASRLRDEKHVPRAEASRLRECVQRLEILPDSDKLLLDVLAAVPDNHRNERLDSELAPS